MYMYMYICEFVYMYMYMYVAYCFLNLFSLCPDVGDHQSATVSPEGVFEDVGQLWLSVGNVLTSLVCQCSDHLLEKRERFVDVESFSLDVSCRLLDNEKLIAYNFLYMYPPTTSTSSSIGQGYMWNLVMSTIPENVAVMLTYTCIKKSHKNDMSFDEPATFLMAFRGGNNSRFKIVPRGACTFVSLK